MATARTALMTAEDLYDLPDDAHRYELVRGELRRMPPIGGEHGRKTGDLTVPLWTHIRSRHLGELFVGDPGFVFERDPDTVLAPDLAFVRAEILAGVVDPTRFLEVVPDLVVEIVSPSDWPAKVAAKVAAYHGFGVPLVWVLDPPPRTLTVHPRGAVPRVLGAGDILDGGNVLPGFRLPLDELFAG